jgi:hypothetical protein
MIVLVVSTLVIVALYTVVHRRARHGRVGTGTMGTMYDLLNEDRKHAVEIIVEQKAEERDPEDRDGNLPDLGSGPKRR